MVTSQLIDIAGKNEAIKEFLEEYLYDIYSIEDLDQYLEDLTGDLLPSVDVSFDAHPHYWLAIIYCRAAATQQHFDAKSLEALDHLIGRKDLGEIFDLAPKYAAELHELLMEIKENLGWPAFAEARRAMTGGDAKWESGDLFALKHESNRYLIGRVLLNTTQCLKGKANRNNARENGLGQMTNYFLVETYRGLHPTPVLPDSPEVVLKGVLVRPDGFKNGVLTKIGRRKVFLEAIDFPEYLEKGMDQDGTGREELRKGELIIPFPDRHNEHTAQYHAQIISPGILLDACFLDQNTFMQSGEAELVSFKQDMFDLGQQGDLRFMEAEFRNEIFTAAGVDPDLSYQALCDLQGIDTSNYLK